MTWRLMIIAFLFTPNLPFMKKPTQTAPFFSLNQKMPVVLGMLLGFQHALAMLAGVVTPPIIISSAANFDTLTVSTHMPSIILINLPSNVGRLGANTSIRLNTSFQPR